MNETLKRGISGAVYIALLLTSIQFSTESFIILFGVFLIIATYEFCNLVQLNKIFPLLFVSLFYTTISLISFYKIETENYINSIQNGNITLTIDINLVNTILLITTLIVSVKCIFFLFDDRVQSISTPSKYLYLLGYILLPFIFIVKISFGIKDYNPKIIIGLFILIWTNDTFAYLVGKSIGKHKLLERISPKKTIEGFIGGLVFTMIGSYLLSMYFTFFSPMVWICTGLIVGFFGTIGDLIESKFKRSAGVKDSGKIMPGHGGILDRLDSVIFAIPFLYLFYQILNYVHTIS